ncbi:MAG: hypothetical protein NUV56_01275 [Candidatus Uhrbacteria bacterium]|nr:hypothetical protein [Candidatus Uhrbacteria bacterium]
MMPGFFTALLFIAAKMLEESVIQSLPLPYALIPVLLFTGVLIMHRSDLATGVVWLVAMALVTRPWGDTGIAVVPLLAAAAAAIPLQQKIFTNRSTYALFGLGLGIFTVMTLTALLVALLHGIWSDTSWLAEHFMRNRGSELLQLLIGLYLGDTIARRLGSWGRRTFFLHR